MSNQFSDPLQIEIDLTGHLCNTWPIFYVLNFGYLFKSKKDGDSKDSE